MFQQIKNILPNTPINIRSLSESVGINDTNWNRNFERIGQLRNDFQSLNSFFQSRPNSSQSHSPEREQSDNAFVRKQLKATEKLLEKLTENVEAVHNADVANFEKAKVADTLMRQLKNSSNHHYEACSSIQKSEQMLKEMQQNVDALELAAVDLMDILPQLEKQIDQVSVTHNRNEFELWKQSQEQQLEEEIKARYGIVREKETALQQKYEQFDAIQRQKKIEVYEASFNAQLEDFRRRKETEVSSIYSQHSGSDSHHNNGNLSAALNKLRLTDPNDDLDSFLGDTASGDAAVKAGSIHEKESTHESISNKDSASETDDECDDGRQVEILEDEDYIEL